MGVIYLLLYFFGAVVVSVGVSRIQDAVVLGEPLLEAANIFGFGGLMILGGGILHTVVTKRRGDDGLLALLPDFGPQGFVTAAALWLVPVLWGWVQFELFWDPVDLYPMITMMGAIALAYGVFSKLGSKVPGFRAGITMLGISFVGLPLGMLSLALPTNHYNYHLTTVHNVMVNPTTHEVNTIIAEADQPTMLEPMFEIGDETLAMMKAFGEAQEIDIEAEIAAGRMKRLDNGDLVRIHEDGTETPIGDAADLRQQMIDAEIADQQAAEKKRAEERAKWLAEMFERKKGGRLFR